MKKVLIAENISDEEINQIKQVSPELEVTLDKSDYESQIIVGNIAPGDCKKYSKMELMLSTWTGYDAYVKKGVLNDNCIFCYGKDMHTEEVAEHMFSTMISMIKNFHLYRDNQNNAIWNDEGRVKSIVDLNVLIIGLGHIGSYLAKLCKGLNMHVVGIKRTMIDKPEYVDELYTIDSLDTELPKADVVFSILPSTNETKHLFSLERFKLMKKDAILINDGRGDLIDTNVLIEVLDNKIIKAIGQDVFENEPLTKDSPLWKYPNLVITPHVAGFFHLEKDRKKWVNLCIENLKHYLNNECLINVVDEREK